MKSPTIKDVAKRANVGIGTVSRVLNNSPRVSEATRQRVLDVIKELGYAPNPAARQLPGGKTFTIGIITPFFTLPSFVERLSGIQKVIHATEYDLVLYSIRSPAHFRKKIDIVLSQKRVDGLIMLTPPTMAGEWWQTNPDLPIVLVDFDNPSPYPSIIINNVVGGTLVTQYLVRCGHTKIGFVGDEIEDKFGFTSSQKRFEGMMNVLSAAKLPVNEAWYRFGKHGQTMAYKNTQKILMEQDRPTAIFASSDIQAFGVITAVRDAGLRVPHDIAVMGFDDIESAKYMNLTTVRQPLVESGIRSAEFLLDWLVSGNRPPAKQHSLPLKVIERATV